MIKSKVTRKDNSGLPKLFKPKDQGSIWEQVTESRLDDRCVIVADFVLVSDENHEEEGYKLFDSSLLKCSFMEELAPGTVEILITN